MAFKTPGVYVEEISVFPPSVAEVETAIPAFIGYTEKAERRGESLTNVPTRVSSLLEYHQHYGGAYEITTVNVTVDENNNHAVRQRNNFSVISRWVVGQNPPLLALGSRKPWSVSCSL